MQKRLYFGKQEERNFYHLGLHIQQNEATGEITIDQAEYAAGLVKISIEKSRCSKTNAPATEFEVSALRAGSGAEQRSALAAQPLELSIQRMPLR